MLSFLSKLIKQYQKHSIILDAKSYKWNVIGHIHGKLRTGALEREYELIRL